MKILFWFNGSGGQRRERKVVEFPGNKVVCFTEIEEQLEDWKDSLHSNSEFQTWGWDDNFDKNTLEPLSKK